MKKLTVFITCIFLIFSFCAAQETETEEQTIQEDSKKESPIDFVFKFGTSFFYNRGDKTISAPSPIYFNPGFGILWPKKSFIAVEPAVSISSTYYLWYEGKAYPAEIENRTATTIALMFDIPAVFTIPAGKSKIQINAGPSILARFGWLSSGATETDDVTSINNYFWGSGRFFYLSGNVSWMFDLPLNTKFGPFFSFYMPVGSIFAHEGMNGMIMSAGIKLSI